MSFTNVNWPLRTTLKHWLDLGAYSKFLGDPVVRTQQFHCFAQVQSQIGELRSCKQHGAAKKQKGEWGGGRWSVRTDSGCAKAPMEKPACFSQEATPYIIVNYAHFPFWVFVPSIAQ